jgi:sulfur relay (sulfurtransferase) DsrC/TusE family protein
MNLGDILKLLLEMPGVPEPYRALRDYFLEYNMKHEADSMTHLIEMRFGKDDISSNLDR